MTRRCSRRLSSALREILSFAAFFAATACGVSPAPLVEGRAAVEACDTCHGVPPADHTPASATSGGTADFADCGACHSGYTSASVPETGHENGIVEYALGSTTCVVCHGDPPPAPHSTSTACGNCHPGYTATTVNATIHQNGIVDGACNCSCCHAIPPPQTHALAPPAAGGTGDFGDCWACHPGNTSTMTAPTHQDGVVDYALGATSCGVCHGVPPPAPHTTSTACGLCHMGYTSTTVDPATHMNGIVCLEAAGCSVPGCTSCHGDATRTNPALAAAPPLDASGNMATTARGVGAHQAHLVAGTMRVAMACTDCHAVPTTAWHSNGAVDLAWGPLASARGAMPSWNGTTCSNYCHGSSLGSGSNHAPAWTIVNGTQDACGTCHGNAIGLPSTGEHAAVSVHASRPCTDCHAGTASATSTTHVNGAVELVASLGWNATTRSCSPLCHGTQSWGGPPPGVPPTVYASPQEVAFGGVPAFGAATRGVRIENLGTWPLVVTGLELCSGTSTAFSLSSTAGFTLAAGASQTIAVTYRPTMSETDAGCFNVWSNDTAHDPTVVALTGSSLIGAPFFTRPNLLDFGNVTAGTSVTMPLVVGNALPATVTITSIRPCDGTTAGFTVSPTTLTLAPLGGTGTVNVTWTPTAAGSVVPESCLALAWPASALPYTIPLAGTAVPPLAPVVSATPNPLAFGSVEVGSSRQLTLALSNVGVVDLVVSGVTRCSGTSSEFAVSSSAFTIPAGSTRSLAVTYTPTGAGTDSGCIALSSNNLALGPYNVNVSGAGVVRAPVVSASPNPLDFGSVQVGSSRQLALTVANTGNATLNVTGIWPCDGTSGEFTPSPEAFSVFAGSSAVRTITYTPSGAGTDTGCLVLSSNDAARNPYYVTVSGTGVAPPPPVISATPNPLDFGYQARWAGGKTLALAVVNTGGSTLSVTRVARCSGTSREFSVPSDAFSLVPGETLGLGVSYDPEDSGADAGCIELASNDPGQPVYRVTVTGTSVQPKAPVIRTNPASLAFGTVTPGSSRSLTVTVSNAGNTTLNVSGVARCSGTSDEFRVSTGGFSVSPGSSRQFSVAYRPGGTGTDSGCVAISSNDPAKPRLEVPVSGTGATSR